MLCIAIHYPTLDEIVSYAFKDGWAAFFEVCWAMQCGYKVSVIHSESLIKANW